MRPLQWLGQGVLGAAIGYAVQLILMGGTGTYFGLIVVWAFPVLLMLWSLSYQFILTLPLSNTLLPIALPTLYLWIVDTLALQRGTWVIEVGTKFGIHVWPHLEFEYVLKSITSNNEY